jgi:2-aminoadipate transaminase
MSRLRPPPLPPLALLLADPPRRTSASPIARALEVAERTPGIVSFACGNPATEALPVDAIAAAAEAVLRDDTDRALQYGRPRGIIQEALVELLAADGIATSADHLLPTTGAIQALSLIAHALLKPGDVVVTEWPTYPVNLASFRTHGTRTIGVPMDQDGIQVEILDRLLHRLGEAGTPAKLIYLIPDAQNPTGITMTRARREALCAAAAEHGTAIVEDGPYRRLVYSGSPEPPVYALAQEIGCRAIFVGSFAKSVAPGLRIGYLAAEPPLIDACVLLKQGEDFCTSGLGQLVVERLIRGGTIARQEAVLAEIQGAKLTAMLAALETEMRGLPVRWTRPSGGLFVWLTLPEGSDTDRILERSIERGVAFIPGPYFYPDERAEEDGRPRPLAAPRHTLRLNFTYPPAKDIPRGVAVLAQVFREML